MKRILFIIFSALLFAHQAVNAQVTLRSTTLAANVASNANDDNVFSMTSVTGIAVGMTYFVDREYGRVLSITATPATIKVERLGGIVSPHNSGATIYVDNPERFSFNDRAGRCVPADDLVATPHINVRTGNILRCSNNEFDLEKIVRRINTNSDSHAVLLNSRNFTRITGSSIGFQSKPAQTVTSTGSVIGGEISPRVNDDIDIANVIGLHVDAFLKGTTAKTVSADVRGLQVELVTDDAGTNTISGNVTGLRMRAAFSASTLTGDMEAIRIEKAEAQTNSQQWDYVLTLTGDNTTIWSDDYTTEVSTAGAVAGAIKVKVGASDRWIALYDTAPTP